MAGGIIWSTLVTLAVTFTLGSYLDGLTVSRFDDLLTARHSQAVVALANTGGDEHQMSRQMANPVYMRPFSGEYWQVESDTGALVVSRSLADALLGSAQAPTTDLMIVPSMGPADQPLRLAQQIIELEDGSSWVVSVGSSTITIEQDKASLQARLNVSLGLIGALAVFGAFLVVFFTLRPLNKLRDDVTARWENADHLPVDNYPQEVQPLVDDINQLIDRNREIISRSRRQTADLAHALKTPSAIMRNELEALNSSGVDMEKAIGALDRLDGQLNRSFARMKASQEANFEQSVTNISQSLDRMGRAFYSLALNRDREILSKIVPDLHAKINQQDLEEIVGNLLDNALKWSGKTIHMASEEIDKTIVIEIEDDGPGISESDRSLVLDSGQRLDTSKPGTGLGLAIVRDLARAYQGEIELSKATELGGLKVIVSLPAAQQ